MGAEGTAGKASPPDEATPRLIIALKDVDSILGQYLTVHSEAAEIQEALQIIEAALSGPEAWAVDLDRRRLG
jgi:hypothetical protein